MDSSDPQLPTPHPEPPPSRWERAKDWFRRLFRLRPTPGRYESDSRMAWRGFLHTRPLVWPRREYLLYLPRGFSRWRSSPLLALCHGCKQTPEDFAVSSRIAEFADRTGWLVLLPRQKDSANPWRCWNWFDRATVEGHGEAAIVAAQIEAVQGTYRTDQRRILVAGMSAGGALAAAVALNHPERVRGAVVHSGLAVGAAATPLTALTVMKRGPETDVEGIADVARLRSRVRSPSVALLAIHGEADDIVAPANTVALVRQFLRFNDHPATRGDTLASPALPDADWTEIQILVDGRRATIRDWSVNGRLVVRYVDISDLGHAWTGGRGEFDFNDPRPPNAMELIEKFASDIAA